MDALGARPSCTVPEATSVLIGTRAQRGASMRNSDSAGPQTIKIDAIRRKAGKGSNAHSASGPTNISDRTTKSTRHEGLALRGFPVIGSRSLTPFISDWGVIPEADPGKIQSGRA